MEQMLRRSVQECLMLRLAESKFGPYFYLADESLGADRTLTYLYLANERILPSEGFVPGQVFSREFVKKFADYLAVLMTPEVTIQTAAEENVIDLDAEVERMHIPLTLVIRDAGETELFPAERLLTPKFYDGKPGTILICSPEDELADHILEILRKMELLNDMSQYARACRILSREAVDGTRFSVRLRSLCESANIALRPERLSKIISYRTYPYMKKKWHNFKKRHSEMSFSWEEVIDLLSLFLSPVWEKLCKGEVFFGDWMPQLHRFLD